MRVETSHAARPTAGETVSGDLPFAFVTETSFVLAVVDALGHGPRAHEAAMLAKAALEQACAADVGVEALFDAVHGALRGSRGAALSVVRGQGTEIELAGVGNVGVRVLGAPNPFVATAGVLGAQLRKLRVVRAPLLSVRFVLHSDGISSRLDVDATRELAPAQAAQRLLESHGVTHDDATVLVADVRLA